MRDLVLWDNHCTMHQGTAFDDTRYPRDMQRTTTSGKPNVFNADLRTARVATA
jgi:alpha-ketoglutarate-dependent taurine dioxygenase